jgi:hypothetical protein
VREASMIEYPSKEMDQLRLSMFAPEPTGQGDLSEVFVSLFDD